MKRLPVRLMLALAALFLGAPDLRAETPHAPLSADAAFEAEKTAFMAMPLETRKAAQDALVWLGFYNGASDGGFGKRTRDSIAAFQKSLKAPGDGALSPPHLQALLAAADKARAAAAFRIVDDPKTGMRIGAPTKLMAEKSGPKLYFSSSADPDLAALYQRLSAETPTRKVAYKAMRPGVFFVVSGQEGAMKFYSRFERNESMTPPTRGFTFSYPTAQNLDRIALAVANSFEPFPSHEVAQTAGAQPIAPVQSSPAGPPVPTATALVIGPGRALTAIKSDDCPNPSVLGKPARFERIDAASGLAVLAGDFGDKSEPPRVGALHDDLVVLSASGAKLAASPATLGGEADKPVIVASLEKSGSGSPAFDRGGDLAGLVAPIAAEPQRIAGVVIAAPHALVGPEALKTFLGSSQPVPESSAPLSAGAIAAREREAVVAVFCGK